MKTATNNAPFGTNTFDDILLDQMTLEADNASVYTFQFPSNGGLNNQVLTTNGSGFFQVT